MELNGEQQLLERIRASDHEAFEQMHEAYYGDLFVLAMKKLGDRDEAYDLLQEMFTELWEKREALFVSNPLYNYLKNRLWFKLSGHYRAHGFRDKHLAAFAAHLSLHPVPQADPVESRELEDQYLVLMQRIDRAVEDMPEKMREVFNLSRSGDHAISDIASILNISPKTVSNQINMAVKRIRQVLSDVPLSGLELAILIWLTKS